MAAVGDDDPVGGQQLADAGRGRARVESAVGRQAVPGGPHDQVGEVDGLAPAGGRRAERTQLLHEGFGDQAGVTAHVRPDVRVRCCGRHVHLDDPRAGREQVAEAHRELVEGGAEQHGDIGRPHGLHRALGAETAGDAEVVARVGENAATQRRAGGERTGRGGEVAEGGAGAGDPRAPAGEQERTLRAGQGRGGVGDGAGGERPGGRERGTRGGGGRLRHRTGLPGGDVVRDRQDRRHPVGERVLDGDDRRGGGVRAADGVGARADGAGERDLVDAPRSRTGCGLVADHQHQRDVRLPRLGERREGVREPGAVGRGGRGQPAGGSVVRVRGDDGAGLVAHRGVRDGPVALQGVEEVGVAVAHDAEDLVDVVGESGGDVSGDRGHDSAFRDANGGAMIRMCLAR